MVAEPAASVRSERDGDRVTLTLAGSLDSATTGAAWREAMAAIEGAGRLTVDASGVSYCDGSGVGLLVELRRRVQGAEVRGLSKDIHALFDQFRDGVAPASREPACTGFIEELGKSTAGLGRDIAALIEYVGELTIALGYALFHPHRVRWKDAFLFAEKAGVNALPIISLVGFLIGLIVAFQAANVLRQFGAEIFVAESVGVSLLRELGPLMTAITLAGRSGAAFAAEIGTMKVNEEINALATMGLSPVRFLVVTRVIAAVAVTPLLTVYLILLGLVGGAVVFVSIGFPLASYLNQLQGALTITDLVGGLVKSFAFGILVAGVGCLRGLQTRTGAGAVGESATRAVVSGLVLIIIADGVFTFLYYTLGV